MRSLFHALGLAPVPGDRLRRADYLRDFDERESLLLARRSWESWKLERRQHFEELNNPSLAALWRGDWDAALRLIEAEREELLEQEREAARNGETFRRVRVVEEPLTPYLQWELHALRLQAECGAHVRVVPADAVGPMEAYCLVPELVALGETTLYEIRYTDAGVPDGAVRYTDPLLITRCVAMISRLYATGEDVRSYFRRAVAHLPPPVRMTMTTRSE